MTSPLLGRAALPFCLLLLCGGPVSLRVREPLVQNVGANFDAIHYSAPIEPDIACSVSLAQGGGKAEPLRIEFKRSTTSTTINGKLRGTEEAEYVLAAKKGQKLIIKLISVPRRSSVFDLKAPENADLGLEYDANYDYKGTLPKTGEYLITVVRPTTSPGTSSYKLVVSVR
jgi:hypothetical protein